MPHPIRCTGRAVVVDFVQNSVHLALIGLAHGAGVESADVLGKATGAGGVEESKSLLGRLSAEDG